METKFNVKDKVYLEVKIEAIAIDHNGTKYKIKCYDYIGNTCTEWVKEDTLYAKT